MSNYNIDHRRLYQDKNRRLKFKLIETPIKYFFLFFILLVLAFFAYKYFDKQPTYTSIVDAPVIRAEAGPHRILPDDPGGMEVAHQDKEIYKEIDPRHPSPAYGDV